MVSLPPIGVPPLSAGRRSRWEIGMHVALGALALAGCGRAPVPVGTPLADSRSTALPPATTPPPQTATADIDMTPDAAGYFVSPGPFLRGFPEYIRLDEGPAGPFMQELQDRLVARDIAWLKGLVDAGADASSGLTYRELTADGPRAPGDSIDTDAILERLTRPAASSVVQGYFASHGEDLVTFSWSPPADVEAMDHLAVVVAGWDGPAVSPESAVQAGDEPALGTAIWRFERRGQVWRWHAWEWVAGGDYRATSAALERSFASPGSGMPATYYIVRPANRWPKPVPTIDTELASPDGRWLARAVRSDAALIDPRDPKSLRSHSAVEVLDAEGDVIDKPLSFWEAGGFGAPVPGIVRWRLGGRELILADWRSGDGCVLHGGGQLYRYDPVARTKALLPVGPDSTSDPTDRWLASVGPDGIAIHDLDAGTTVSATFTARVEEYFDATWAPDSSAVAFTIVDEYRDCADYRRSHVVRFDRDGGPPRDLTRSAPGGWRVERWHEDGRLEVVVKGPRLASGEEPTRTVWLDAATGAAVGP